MNLDLLSLAAHNAGSLTPDQTEFSEKKKKREPFLHVQDACQIGQYTYTRHWPHSNLT